MSRLALDIPDYNKLDKHNLFLYLFGIYFRISRHKTFIFPSSANVPLTNNMSLFKVNYFSVRNKILQMIGKRRESLYLADINYIDFNNQSDFNYYLDTDIWKRFRTDQNLLYKELLIHF